MRLDDVVRLVDDRPDQGIFRVHRDIFTEPGCSSSARCELAAAYRLAALFGWSYLISNHFSVRVPGTENEFLINPFGLMFEEITASSLVKVDQDSRILDRDDCIINPAGFVIHSCILAARPDVGCIVHLHTRDGTAVATQEDGLLPITLNA